MKTPRRVTVPRRDALVAAAALVFCGTPPLTPIASGHLPMACLAPGPVGAALLSPLGVAPARAAGASALWRLDVPSAFAVRRRVSAISGTRPETLLLVVDSDTGVEIKLVCVPLSDEVATTLDSGAQAALIRALVGRAPAGSTVDVVSALARSLDAQARSPASPILRYRMGAVVGEATRSAAPDARGNIGATRRYVTYRFQTERCPAYAFQDGDCDAGEGRDLWREHLGVAAVGTIAQARIAAFAAGQAAQPAADGFRQLMDGSGGAPMDAGGVPDGYALWLLSLSAPAAVWTDELEHDLCAVADTFEVL